MKRLVFAAFVVLLLQACNFGESDIATFLYNFDIAQSDNGWSGDFSDYPEGDSLLYGLEISYETLPENLNTSRKGIKVTGFNYSDDLFMFIKRKLTGLQPNTTYTVLFNVRFASNAPTGQFGAEGAPGESVIVKVGATAIEPDKVMVAGYYQMNIDKGDLAQGGADAIPVGHVGVSATTTAYTEIYRNNNSDNPLEVTTNSEGEVWIIIGTDSGYEGRTTLYYTNVDVVFNRN